MTRLQPGTGPAQSLTRSTLIGVSWLVFQNFGSRAIGFAAQIVLAKILLPADFGILAVATTVTTVIGVIANFGVEDVLLQRPHSMRFWTRSAFIASLSLGIAGMLLVWAAAPLAAYAYAAPTLLTLLPLMATAMPLTSLSTVPAANLRAALNFRFPALYGSMEMLLTQALTIALALAGFGVFSFAIPAPIAAAVRAIVFWSVTRPRLGPMRRRQLRMMGSNSAAVFGSRMLTIMVGQGDYFVLGLLASKSVVGAYFFAFSLAIQPIRMIAGNFSTVLFPAFANIRNDPVRQTEAAVLASRITAFTVLPYCFLQAAVAQPLLRLVFGEKWDAAIPLIEILSIGLGFDAVSWIAGALLQARGEFRRAFIYSMVFFPIFFLLVGTGAVLGTAVGVATAVSLFYLFLAPVYSFLVFRTSGVSLRTLAGIYLPPTLLSGFAIVAARGLAAYLSLDSFATLLLTAILGGGVYLILARLFAAEIYREIAQRLRHFLRDRGA